MGTQPYTQTVTAELDVAEDLTDSSAKEVHVLLEQNKGNRKRITDLRTAEERKIDKARREIASLDRVLSLLDKQDKDLLEQLHQPPVVLPMQVVQDQPAVSTADRTIWDGNTPPETGMWAATPELSPDPEKNIAALVEQWDAQAEREGEPS